MKTKLIKTSATIISPLLLIIPIFVFAQIKNPLGSNNNDIPTIVSTILGYVVEAGGVVAVCAFIWVGFSFVKAQGNPEALKTAKTGFYNTCIGVALLIGAKIIASIIINTISNI
jgi:hypothetical protein